MAFINSRSTFAVKSELDFFTAKSTQNCVVSGYFQESRPISVIETDAPIEFFIAESEDYIDLGHCQLQIRVKITHEDGSALKETDSVSLCNNFLHTLFEHVAIDLNGRTITTPSNSYAYRSYIETLLNYSNEAKSTHLASALFSADEPGKFDDVTSSGFANRKKLMHKNGVVELSGYIHGEIFSQDKYLINGINLRVKFYRSKPTFCLMTAESDLSTYKIDISDAILLVRKAKINPSVMVAHERALSRGNIKMNLNRVDVKTISLSANLMTKSLDNIFIGAMPKRIILGMVSAAAFNSSIHKNPFFFQSFDHTYIHLSSDSHTHIQPIKSNFAKGLYLQSYLSLFSSSGICFSDTGNAISRISYPLGNALVGFDLTEDLSASDNHLSLPRQGSLRVDLQFAKALPEPVCLILYAEFDSLLEIDKSRNIFIDYSS